MTTETTPTPVPSPAEPRAPGLSPRRRKSLLRTLFEVALITLGVFFGLLADQWRERAADSRLADETLQRIHAEFVKNRDAVMAVREAHDASLSRIQSYLQASPEEQKRRAHPFESTSPAFLEYTAWDLAIATEALRHIPPDLAQAVAHIYAVQRQLDDATRDITQVMYTRIGEPDPRPFLGSAAVYFGDCGIIEPRLLALYADILPRLEAAQDD